jgi:hypothetical protein
MAEKPIAIEVEDREIAIRSSKGVLAVIPKGKAKWVKDMIAKGEHRLVDEYVSKLPKA